MELPALPQKPNPSQSFGQPKVLDTALQPPESGFDPTQVLRMVQRKAPVIVAVALSASAFSGFQVSRQTPSFQSSFALLVEPVTQKRQLSKLTDGQTETTKELDYSTQIEVMLSPKTLEGMIKEIKERYPDVNYDLLSSKLSVNRLGETKIIEVSYSGSDPDKVKHILEKLSKGYLKHSLEEQKLTLRQGIEFIDEQLPALRKRVVRLQEQIQTLRQQYNFVDPDAYTQQLATQLSAITQQRQTIRAETATLRARYDILQQQAGAAAALNNSNFYQEFLKQYQALDRQIAIESARFGDNNPTIKMLRQQQANLAPLLQNEAMRTLHNQSATLFNEMQVLQTRDRVLAQTAQRLEQLFQQGPVLSRQYTDLQRELKAATESLQRFNDTRESLEIQASQSEVPWQLIAPPKNPESKVVSNVYKSLMTGGVMGVGIGVAIAFLLEKVQSTFFTLSDLRKKSKVPIVGIIPFRPNLEHAGSEVHIVDFRHLHSDGSFSVVKDVENIKTRVKSVLRASTPQAESCKLDPASPQTSPLNIHEQDTYGFIEAFRALYAGIQSIDKNQILRSLVISSALPVEGRTTVAVHLAQAAAALGKRVLLVDAHLRSGSANLHTLLGLPFSVGLSNLLREEVTLEQTIQRLDWESSLFVVTAGTIPPDPTRLLASKQMKEFMQRVHKTFDLVIYDTLPLMGLADVSLIAAETNGVILVTGFGKWRGAYAYAHTLERLESAQIPIIGVVANGVKNYSVDLYAR